jgi:hypothetical protein
MAEIIIEMQKVIYKFEKPSEELAFVYYILFICSHVYSMRQKKVLNEDEWFNPAGLEEINKSAALITFFHECITSNSAPMWLAFKILALKN